MHAFDRHLLHDRAVGRRAQGQRPSDRPRALKPLDLVRGDIPVLEALERRLGKLPRRAADLGRGAGHVLKRAPGQTIFPLGNNEFRRVDLHQWLAARHGLAGSVDVELLYPAFELGVDDVQPPLVGLNGSDGADCPGEHARLDGRGLDAELLHAVGADLDSSRVVGLLAFSDGDIVHPHRVLLWQRRGVRQAHRIAVVKNPPFPSGRGGRRRRRPGSTLVLAFVDGDIVHPDRVLLRLGRVVRLAHWIAVIEDFALDRCSFSRGDGGAPGRHAGAVAAEPIPAGADHNAEAKQYQPEEGTPHRSLPICRSIAARAVCASVSTRRISTRICSRLRAVSRTGVRSPRPCW